MRARRIVAALSSTALLLAACADDGAGEVQVSSSSVEPSSPTPEPTAEPTAEATPDPTTEPTAPAAPAPSPEPATEPTADPGALLAGTVIAIDPSHNGGHPDAEEEISRLIEPDGLVRPCNTIGGATADGVTESAINWAVAQDVAAKLGALGAEVELTREDDEGVGPCVDERGRFAAEVGADLLVSLHADAGPEDGRGFHVQYPLEDRSVASTDTLADGARLAGAVRDTLVAARFPVADYTAVEGLEPRDDVGTLNVAAVPAVSITLGNLAHPADAGLLSSRPGQERVAGALAAAIARYLAG